MKKINFNIPGKYLALLIVFFLALILSIVIFKVSYPKMHRTFYFEKLDTDGLFMEKRYVPVAKGETNVYAYVSELLLGPITPRYKPVFPLGTKVLSCFQRENELFVNLSKDLLKNDISASKYWDGAEIFKKNVFKNFRNIDIIHIYIDGNRAFVERSENQL